MNSICPFCQSETRRIDLPRLDLRICPHCLATFFPSDKTMAFRREVVEETRSRWLSALERRREDWVEPGEDVRCIDHGQKLVDGKLPDYGLPGKVATCCEMFQLPASTMHVLLQRMGGAPVEPKSSKKHHFAIIVLFSKIVDKLLGTGDSGDDGLDSLQYHLKFKDVLEKPSET